MIAPRPSAWTFDRTDRLAELVTRGRMQAAYLRRSACDLPVRSAAWHRLQSRLAVVDRRVRCLCAIARVERRTALSSLA